MAPNWSENLKDLWISVLGNFSEIAILSWFTHGHDLYVFSRMHVDIVRLTSGVDECNDSPVMCCYYLLESVCLFLQLIENWGVVFLKYFYKL